MWDREQQINLDPVEVVQCKEILDGAIKHDLLIEVLETALRYKAAFPNASMLQCLQEGAIDWDL